ncbi:13497_t:CDS:2 [Funneliformis caledonium]|uniref:13497_t:CDS:1 n=1 Tax=Funneliformis caledonium TaxID=1117310 RepID=A0A9N9CNQ2_9GLOM|nr:13497_t:CDS:2 [Funneliformis caledonium]
MSSSNIPILLKNRKSKVSESTSAYHKFFKTTEASEWNFSKFISFLIDTDDDEAKPIFAEKIWQASISKLSRDNSVPQAIRKFTAETLTHHFAENDCTAIQNALKSLEEISSSKLIFQPKISLARHVSETSGILCSTAISGKRDRVFASYMMSEEPCPKVQKVDHDIQKDDLFSGPSKEHENDTEKVAVIFTNTTPTTTTALNGEEIDFSIADALPPQNTSDSNSSTLGGSDALDLFSPIMTDVVQKEDSYFQELSLVERLYTSQEWMKMELDWEKMEEKIASSLPLFEENMQSLLKKYSESIKDASTGYYVDLNKVETTISQSPFADQHSYLFVRDWPLRWAQQLYTAFLTCFQTPINPLNDADASEYAYRSRLINHFWEDVFFDVNCVIRMKTGEVENVDRRNQLGLARNPDDRRSNVGSWYHDAILIMKVGDKDVQVAFGEVVGNAFKHDDTKLYEDREKILKAMQLALFNLRKLLPEKDPGLEDLETFGLLVYIDGIYLVDQFSGFTIPDTPLHLGNLPDMIHVMIMFKHRVMKLRQHVESLYKSKKSFKRGGTRHTNDSTVYASPQKKSK